MSGFDANDKEFDSDEDEESGSLSLSPEALRALMEFATEKGCAIGGKLEEAPEQDILKKVQEHFDIQDKNEVFPVNLTSSDGSRTINFNVKGLRRELGQTLSSTGLTIWRAAFHMCDFIFDNPSRFTGKTCCELGAGLGMVAILLDKMNVAAEVYATDGDTETLELLKENVESTESKVLVAKLYWGENDCFREVVGPDKRFDILFAADVIYDENQIKPLIASIIEFLSASGEFLLAFARRNVPIDKVLEEAVSRGLQYEVLDSGLAGQEPIFRLTFAD